MFCETVVLLSKGMVDSRKVKVDFFLEDMDLSEFKGKIPYKFFENCRLVKSIPFLKALRKARFSCMETYLFWAVAGSGIDVKEN